MVEKILSDTTPYGKIRASHEGLLHSSTLNIYKLLLRSKYTCIRDFSKRNEMVSCKISKWKVSLGTPDRVNIPAPCMTHASVKRMLKYRSNYKTY